MKQRDATGRALASTVETPVTMADIETAARRMEECIHRTPVLTSGLIDIEAGAKLFFKCENLQLGGAFKARGAHNAVLSLTPQARRAGVATHSSGNHAAALALAARRVGVPAFIVMPENAPIVKVNAVKAYGGQLTICAPSLAAREAGLADVCERTGAHYIPPYDHASVIAGQGTCVLELSQQLEQPPDFVITPVGGGGLLAGSAIASRAVWPQTRVIGAEPAGADDAQRSLQLGVRQPQESPDTIADGLRTLLGELNFAVIKRHVDEILVATDAQIIAAMRLIWTRMKLVVEPSAVVGLAVVLAHPERFCGARIAIVLTGGNVDLDCLPWRTD